MNILISGSTGFVGQSLCTYLKAQAHTITTIDRKNPHQTFLAGNYDCFINLAGRAHVMQEIADDVYQAYASINIDYSLKMASLAHKLNIKRLIFLSSIKVNGESSEFPFTPESQPMPVDCYGKTKLEAELTLQEFCAKNSIELVIIRPPLIYGPGVKANFKSLITLCKRRIPLPFASINNKRSLISLENLNSFIDLCCRHPHAANQTFLISDDHDVSTAELIRSIRAALDRSAFLVPTPSALLKLVLSMLGKSNLSERLLSNLQVDISKAKQLLGWQPVISFDEGIKRSVREYLD